MMPSQADLRLLLAPRSGPCVSLFLPARAPGANARQNPIRWKNRLAEADRRLERRGLCLNEREALLEPARALIPDEIFWEHQRLGLAAFLADAFFHQVQIPGWLPDQTVVGREFYLAPLLPWVTEGERFYLLVLNLHGVALYTANRLGMTPMALPDAPAGLAEAVRVDQAEPHLQLHTSGHARNGKAQAGLFHGQGAERDENKDRILRYFQAVNHAVHRVLKNENAPLVLAGTDYLIPLYRQACHYPHLVPAGIPLHVDGRVEAGQLHTLAWAAVEPWFRAKREVVAERVRQFQRTMQTSQDLRRIVPAAVQGAVELLFLAEGTQAWGDFSLSENRLRWRRRRGPEDRELLNYAALQTLAHDGRVLIVPPEDMPVNGRVAALFRYAPVAARSS